MMSIRQMTGEARKKYGLANFTGRKTGIAMLTATFLIVNMSGCSNKQMYQAIHHTNTLDCLKLPANQREECLNREDRTWEDYERERKEITEARL